MNKCHIMKCWWHLYYEPEESIWIQTAKAQYFPNIICSKWLLVPKGPTQGSCRIYKPSEICGGRWGLHPSLPGLVDWRRSLIFVLRYSFFHIFLIRQSPLWRLLLLTATLLFVVFCVLQSQENRRTSLPCSLCSRIQLTESLGPILPWANSQLSLFTLRLSLGGTPPALRLFGKHAFLSKLKNIGMLPNINFQLLTKLLNTTALLTRLALFVGRGKTWNTLSSNVSSPNLAGVVFDHGQTATTTL